MTSRKYKNKDLIVFDLDGTLTPSKSNLEPDMAQALGALLERKKVAVIGGGNYAQFRKQFLGSLTCPKELLSNLFLFPTTATAFYRYQNGWKNIYKIEISKRDREKIIRVFKDVLRGLKYVPPKMTYGKVIEDRGSQVTFSALGQDIVALLGKKGIRLKEEWKKKNTPLKNKIARLVQEQLPRFEVRTSAYTSIDVTRKGVDKAYGVRRIGQIFKIPIRNMIFVGDGLYRGGNDAAAKKTGIDCVAVRGPEDTKKVIKEILKES